MKETLFKYCRSLGLTEVGIVSMGPFEDLKNLLLKRQDSRQEMVFDSESLDKKINPKLTMPSGRSIIVFLMPYYSGNQTESQYSVSKYCRGLDYHLVVKNLGQKIGDYMGQCIRDFEYEVYADTGPLVDRFLAYKAGLGVFGLNTHIINERYGSFVSIGYMITNYDFEPDQPIEGTCKRCGRCIKACPGQALNDKGVIDSLKCKSYLTQKKGDLQPWEKEIIKKTDCIFGCDICQDVCPHNKGIEITPLKEFTQDLIDGVEKKELQNMTNKEFKKTFGHKAFSWRGKAIIIRNIEYLEEKRKD